MSDTAGSVASPPAAAPPATMGTVAPPAPSSTTPPVGSTPPAAVATPPVARTDGKPGWLPEKFKDEESFASSFKELERSQFTRRETIKGEIKSEMEAERLKDVPAAPGDYKFEPIKLPDGRPITLKEGDPLLDWFQSIAHEMKLPQGQYQRVISEFIQKDMQRGPNWETESKVLGESAELRLDRIDGWMKGNATQEVYGVFASMPATAGHVKMFEHIMTLAGEPAFVPSETPSGFIEGVTKESLMSMQKDPKYWREKDPAFVRQVRAGYRKLAMQSGEK